MAFYTTVIIDTVTQLNAGTAGGTISKAPVFFSGWSSFLSP